ncbi:MAG TPA: corrinoid protein [Anaerolineaceae bacterium]|jgi:5-methyltetrahydrofolate--homocysteine methyltransferase
MDPKLQAIYDAILNGERAETPVAVHAALDAGLDPATILSDGMIAAMKEVGRLFEEKEYYVPEMLLSARTMQAGLAVLKPELQKGNVKAAGKVAIGTVKGDLHDIGKNLVAMMLEGSGFEVIDLGVDVDADKFVATVREQSPDLVCLSALLTTTMPMMEKTIRALEAAGVRQNVKVMIGGAPVNQAFANQIGADGYSADASRAVTLALSLVAA